MYGARTSHPDVQLTYLIGSDLDDYSAPADGPLVPLGRALTDAGLHAAKIGKWHLSSPQDLLHPLEHGWTNYAGVMGNLRTGQGESFENFTLNVDGPATVMTGTYLTTLETDLGIYAMHAGYDLVSDSYHAIHRPFHVPPAELYSGPVPTTDVERARAMLEALGRELMRLACTADQLGYQLILFSDNGGVGALGGAKGSLLEAGIRTRAWVYGPGVQPGVDDSLVGAYDIYATVLEFFGLATGPNFGPDSVSFLPTWGGQPGTRQYLFQERYEKNGEDPAQAPREWLRAIVGPASKLVMNLDQPSLFRLLGPELLMEALVPPTQFTPADEEERDTLLHWLEEWTGQ